MFCVSMCGRRPSGIRLLSSLTKIVLFLILIMGFQNCGEFGAIDRPSNLGSQLNVPDKVLSTPHEVADQIAFDILVELNNRTSLLHMINNLDIPHFDCLRNATLCSEATNSVVNQNGYAIKYVHNSDGLIVFDGMDIKSGYDFDLEQCDNFNFAFGNDSCPFRARVYWRPICEGEETECLNPDSIFFVEVDYKPQASLEQEIFTHFVSGAPYDSALMEGLRDQLIDQCDNSTGGQGVNGDPECGIIRSVPCDVDNGTGEKLPDESVCHVTSCESGYTSNTNGTSCNEDTVSCNIQNGTAERTYNPDLNDGEGGYGSCELISCNSGHKYVDSSCLSTTAKHGGCGWSSKYGSGSWGGRGYTGSGSWQGFTNTSAMCSSQLKDGFKLVYNPCAWVSHGGSGSCNPGYDVYVQ